jgi:uncharacterized protein (DUF1499 family)
LNRLPWSKPPGFFKRLSTYLSIHVAELRPDSEFEELRPKQYDVPVEVLGESCKTAAEKLGWQLVSYDAGTRRLHLLVSTPTLGFKDDVIVEPQAAEPGKSFLKIVSTSRVGRADFGANARHVLDFVEKLEAVLPRRER